MLCLPCKRGDCMQLHPPPSHLTATQTHLQGDNVAPPPPRLPVLLHGYHRCLPVCGQVPATSSVGAEPGTSRIAGPLREHGMHRSQR